MTGKPTGQIPVITKTLPCLRCAANTSHDLVPYSKGCNWTCQICSDYVHAYNHREMRDLVMQKAFGLPPTPPQIKIPKGLKVFLKHNGPEADEKQASDESVLAHVRVAGKLPVVGKPLFATAGSSHPGAAIPYGEVVRVEHEQTTD